MRLENQVLALSLHLSLFSYFIAMPFETLRVSLIPFYIILCNYYFFKVKQSPSNVALSIQKLALSVHDTGMFGDLPKPRVKSSHRH